MTQANGFLAGYAGKILRINLGENEVVSTPLPERLADEYLGGRGFVARLAYDEIKEGVHPLSEDNKLIIATGPLTGHFLPGSGKLHFGSKSPATGGYGDSNMGGHFGPTIKYAGYDVIIISGRAEKPSYIFIDDHEVEIRSAQDWWGQGAITAEKQLKEELGEDFQIMTIGPAGEQMVKYACISHDFGRQAGRTGMGALLGSKNIKAIAVRGTGSLSVDDVEGAYEKGKEALRDIYSKPGFKGWTPEGTAGITDWVNEVGAFPTRNFQTSFAEHHQDINGKAILEELKITDKGCFSCPTPCGKYGYAETELGSTHVEGPEYETIALLGGNCDLKNIHQVAYANYLCDELGLDTISAGVVIGWAIECFEKGVLSTEDVGREIAFGDLATVEYLLQKIASRQGIGDLLAEGVKKASEELGQGSEEFAIHIKGLEWSGYESRNAPGMMLAYMTADIGAHHNRAWALGHDVAGSGASVHDLISGEGGTGKMEKAPARDKSSVVIDLQHNRPLYDALGICRLQNVEIGFEVEHYEEILELITGQKRSWDQLLKISEKIWNLTRAYSLREIDGFGREYDYPPPRFYQEPIPSGPNEGHYLTEEELEAMLDEYYQARGWDKNGVPTDKKLEELGLSDLIPEMEKIR